MSCYIIEPYNRNEYLIRAEKLIRNFEMKLFENPGIERISKKNKFCEKFDLEFEDTFNPLASYFYTAPSYKYNVNYNKSTNKSDGLDIYWHLACVAESYGEYSCLLRIIHVLGQMVSIWPEEGFNALSNFCKYSNPIIRKGLIRVIKENYIRYPAETLKFFEQTGNAFTQEEISEIKTTPVLGERTLEQLHWCRILYFLVNNFDEEIIFKILATFQKTSVLGEFIKNLVIIICS
jgi:hypothetical protein